MTITNPPPNYTPFGIEQFLQGAIGAISDGTVETPGLRFTNDPDTGIYRVTDDIMGFVAGGVEMFRIDEESAQKSVTINEGAADIDFIVKIASGATALTVVASSGITEVTALELTSNAGIQLKTGAANPSHSEGLVFYDNDEKALAVYNDASDVTVQLGQEMLVRATNKTGVTITDGTVVYINGVQGNRPTIALARSDSASTATVIGVATHDILNNATGFITVFGLVHSFDTSGFTAGDTLWLDPSTAGAVTNTMPSAPNFPIQVGTAINSTENGKILVNTGPTDVVGTMVINDLDINVDLRVAGDSILTGLQIQDTSADHQYIYGVAELAANRTVSLPLLTGNDEFVFKDHAVTLTNKSIDADNNPLSNIGIAEFETNQVDREKLADGAYLDSPDVTVASNGTTITMSVEKSGGGDIRVIFSTGVHVWGTDPTPDTVALTAGTDTVPVENFVYFLESNKTLTASTVGWPVEEHAPVATVITQSAASAQTDGVLKMHAWTDHMSATNDGHLAHLNFWIRGQHATWKSGVAPTFSGSGTGTVGVASTSGVILQLHDHTYPASSDPADIYVKNFSGTAYNKITNIADIVLDSTGASLNNRYYGLVIWGVVSEADADCKVYANVSSGSYVSEAGARADANKFTDFGIPDFFKGTGFLIHRAIIRVQGGGATVTILAGAGDDIRGQFPDTSAGTTTAIATEFPDSTFRIFDDADNTKQAAFDASSITTATLRTYVLPDADGTLALTDLDNAFSVVQTFSAGISVDDTTDSTSGTTGSIHTDGGLGVVLSAVVGGNLLVNGGSASGINGGIAVASPSANSSQFVMDLRNINVGASAGLITAWTLVDNIGNPVVAAKMEVVKSGDWASNPNRDADMILSTVVANSLTEMVKLNGNTGQLDVAVPISMGGSATIADASGNLTSANGASFGPGAVSSITVLNGIVTAIS